MKKDYNTKKKATIIALSLTAVCVAAGLFYYVGTLGNNEPPTMPDESQPTTESQIVVPEIKPGGTQESNTGSESTPPPTTESSKPVSSETLNDAQGKPSDGKPKTPEQAVPPTKKPTEADKAPVENPDNNSQCQPEQKPKPEQDQPQGGDTKKDGSIYVPGFGWIEDSGEENTTTTAPNAGTGKPVGEM